MNKSDKFLVQSNKETIAIVLMDLQPRLLSTIPKYKKILSTNSLLLQAARLLAIPILVTEQVPEKLGSTEESLKSLLDQSTVYTKNSFSAFGCDTFSRKISDLKITHLILTGIELPICVFLTACDALQRNLKVTVLSDCVGCRRLSDGEVAFSELRSRDVSILPLETFLFQHLKSSTHPNFREVSEMIRNRSI